MQTNRPRSDLTPEAERVLNALLDDVRAQILIDASGRSVEGVITAADIIASYERSVGRERSLSYARTTRSRRLFLLYGILGIASVAAAVLIAFLQQGEPTTIPTALVATTAAVVAASAGSAAYLLSRSRKLDSEREDSRTSLYYLEAWNQLEDQLRSTATTLAGSSRADKPFSGLFEILVKAGALAEGDVQDVRQCLQIRNALVHGVEPVSRDALTRQIAVANSLTRRLRDFDRSIPGI